MNEVPKPYKSFIESLKDLASLDQLKLKMLFALHNNFVNPNEPEHNTHCKVCIAKVWKNVSEYFGLN